MTFDTGKTYSLTITSPNGTTGHEWHTLQTMRDELAQLAKVLDALVPGESVTITRHTF